MAESRTTLTVETDARERLNDYIPGDQYNMTEVLDSLMALSPTIEEYRDGCTHCGKEPYEDFPGDAPGGVVLWYNPEREPGGTAYFCSTECAKAEEERWSGYVPEYPDLVVVGGAEEMRVEVSNATFYLDPDGGYREVGIPIPGAFGGEDDQGREYAYEGEPVYVKNDDRWVQKGVIDRIIHEETHTGLLLGFGLDTVMRYHPDEEKREEYLADDESADADAATS